MKKIKLLISIFSIFLVMAFLGCSKTKKVEPKEEKQDGSTWEKDMNKLIEKATPKDNK